MRKQHNGKIHRDLLIHFYLQEIATPEAINEPSKKVQQQASPSKKRITCDHILPGSYLTQQEYRCLSHLIEGLTVKKTADQLDLSPRTVEFYLANIKTRFNVKKKRNLIELFSQNNYTFSDLID